MFQMYYKLFLQVPKKLQLNWVKGTKMALLSPKSIYFQTNSTNQSTSKLFQIINTTGSMEN